MLLSNIAIELLGSRWGEVGTQGNLILLPMEALSILAKALDRRMLLYLSGAHEDCNASDAKEGKTKRVWYPSP